MLHVPSPAASRNTFANGSVIRGASDVVSAARAAATPSAVIPTLSVMFQESSSVLGMLKPSHPDAVPTLDGRGPLCGMPMAHVDGGAIASHIRGGSWRGLLAFLRNYEQWRRITACSRA